MYISYKHSVASRINIKLVEKNILNIVYYEIA